MNYETMMIELEKIVKRLESGSLPLDEALKLYSEGMRLSGKCSQKLDDTEGKIAKIIKEGINDFDLKDLGIDID